VVFIAGFVRDVPKVGAAGLPIGDNYLDPANAVTDAETSTLTFGRTDPLTVKPGQTYLLSVPDAFIESGRGSVEIETLIDGMDGQAICFEDMDFTPETGYDVYTVSFTLDGNIDALVVNLMTDSEYFQNVSDPYVDYMLEEGNTYDGYEGYLGEATDTDGPSFENLGTVTSYYDAPITIQEIQDSLVATDEIDGDVSTTITHTGGDYTNDPTTLGAYWLSFEAADSAGNVTECIVSVDVVDVLAPVFSEISELTVVFPNVMTTAEILAQMNASDNFDGDISDQIEIADDGYTANASVIGDYTVKCSVSDANNNVAIKTITIHVVDQQAPLITGPAEMTTGYGQVLDVLDIKNQLSVSDNYDALSLNDVAVAEDTYSANAGDIGSYTIAFEAVDSSGNTTIHEVSVEVADLIGPSVYVDDAVIQTYVDRVLTLEDFADILLGSGELDAGRVYDINIAYDSYTDHATTPGTYHLHLDFVDENEEIISKKLEIVVKGETYEGRYQANPEAMREAWYEQKETWCIGGLVVILIGSNLWWHFKKR
jgi:hypothetical protein